MSPQSEWRFCDKCMGMFYNGYPTKGHCPAGGGHNASGFNFFLTHDVPEAPGTQHNWRYCGKCEVMFFDGYPTKGHCAAGGGHIASGFNFVLPYNRAEPATYQHDWRFCDKCMGMFFDGYPTKGRCPAGGSHNASGFNFVLPHDLVEKEGFDLGDPTGSGRDHDPPNDPPGEDGPTKNPDNRSPGEVPEAGCFIGSTQVLMAGGMTKAIEDIAVGDTVIARDENTGVFDTCTVDQVFRHLVAKTLLLEIEGGEVIETTAEHRFASPDRGFIGASRLKAQDLLMAYGEGSSRVVATQPKLAEAIVYNLSVARLHTYFIGGATLWVHNVKKDTGFEEP